MIRYERMKAWKLGTKSGLLSTFLKALADLFSNLHRSQLMQSDQFAQNSKFNQVSPAVSFIYTVGDIFVLFV